jgi:hypothetical protein
MPANPVVLVDQRDVGRVQRDHQVDVLICRHERIDRPDRRLLQGGLFTFHASLQVWRSAGNSPQPWPLRLAAARPDFLTLTENLQRSRNSASDELARWDA